MEIFVANIDPGIQEELLAKLFEVFGSVSNTVIAKDKTTGASRGFGFVTMDNAIEAQRAIDDLNGRELAGKMLSVKESIPKNQKSSGNKPDSRRTDNNGDGPSDSSMMKDDFEKENSFKVKNEGEDVIDKTEFTKTELEDGLVKISFKK